MIVLIATQEQYNALNGYKCHNSELVFVQNADGEYFVCDSVLTDPDFSEINDALNELQKKEI